MKGNVTKMFAALSAGIAFVLIVSSALGQPAEPTKDQDAPARNQQWLKQLVGEWDTEWKMYMQPGQPPMEATGADSVRELGDNWIVAEARSMMMGAPFSGILSLGYNAQENRFHGAWIDSFGGTLWVYEGTLNDAGDTLTLETEGPSLEAPGETTRYREVIQITGKDSRTFKSFYESEDGAWIRIVEIEYRRKVRGTPSSRNQPAPDTKGVMDLHYLEIVTTEMDTTCELFEQSQGVTFSEPAVELGNARTTRLTDNGRIGVRAPMGAEQPVVRLYVVVDDIQAAIEAAQAAGAEVLAPPTEIPGKGSFALYYLGKIEHGLWQNP